MVNNSPERVTDQIQTEAQRLRRDGFSLAFNACVDGQGSFDNKGFNEEVALLEAEHGEDNVVVTDKVYGLGGRDILPDGVFAVWVRQPVEA